MLNKVKEQIKWLIGELLNNTSESIMVHVIYNKQKDEARIYLNGERIATLSKVISIFNFPLTDKQIEELYRLSKEKNEKES